MLVAVVIDQKENIVPIIDGSVIRVYNTETNTHEDFHNPAVDLTEGRRGAALSLAIDKGAAVFVAPPETFCELSYEKAKSQNIQFYRLNAYTSFQAFQALIQNQPLPFQNTLPEKEIVPSYVQADSNL
ncbi:hypothetical protein RRU94_07760 [Domibacillus sp. DTU_2020_1001157_1_SI_ALB_TIR_016]|uniref:hypothetical protein n=1 Tax=Domibacillus sp. DTU_2020_1001157_1_SI_ALB_TIR_016 TaxID=3077789 RepID=UPI0028EEFAB0|nr:hypothetical protein [Domibacillus sp. DTU_2020_1001157_1_SI_ALB_TIR_016]WNS78345.1 hypothetical protein RRU94_07760 [Domibacillus sp. DTU_2020_1001157_1_SI_ALB_TIR_016]